MAINKIIYGGRTLIDLTADTVTSDKLLSGYTTHDKTGASITGTCTFNADTTDATATADELLKDKTAYVNGVKVTGKMKNVGAVAGKITNMLPYTVPIGYHDGSGTVAIDELEKKKLIPANIRQGITILGVAGTMSTTEGSRPQSKSVTPSTESQTILPDSGYNCLSQVTVTKIPYTESSNSAGGTTVTIAG